MQSYGFFPMNVPKEKSFAFGAIYYLFVSLAIILLASPLFRILGFEYSGIVSLFASIHLLYYSAGEARKIQAENFWAILKSIWFKVFLLANIPLFISIIS